jgi:hypothetical protein
MHLRAAVILSLVACAAQATEVSLDVVHFDGFETPASTAFRLGQLALRDPHVFYQAGPLCLDVTDTPNLGLNAQIAASLAADDNADGTLDSSALLAFAPLRIDGAPGRVTTLPADCSVATPMACTPVAAAPQSTRIYRAFSLAGSDRCLEPLAGTTSNWGGSAVAVPQPGGACYGTSAADLVLDTGALAIPLFDTSFGAPLPAAVGSTGGGLMRGFLRASDAALVTFNVNGSTVTLASLLPGGAGSCKANVTGGVDTWRGETGWWFYFEYRQDAVTF